MKNKNYYVPLMLIFCLFFLWAISSNLLPTMIRQLMKTCELNAFEASFTETAYWLAYFICPIPIAMFMKKYSYKSGIIFGLLLAACGGLLFFPAAMLKEYWAYLCIFFIIATGMCFLETAANPGTIIQWAGSFYSRHVSQQTDSEWQPLYPRHPAHFFSRWLGRLHSNRNRRHETSLSAASYATHCYCHHLYLLQIT